MQSLINLAYFSINVKYYKRCSVDNRIELEYCKICFRLKEVFFKSCYYCISKDIVFSNFVSPNLKLQNRYCHRSTYLFVLIFSMGLALAGMMAGTKMGSSKLAKSLSSSKSEKLEKELLGTL